MQNVTKSNSQVLVITQNTSHFYNGFSGWEITTFITHYTTISVSYTLGKDNANIRVIQLGKGKFNMGITQFVHLNSKLRKDNSNTLHYN